MDRDPEEKAIEETKLCDGTKALVLYGESTMALRSKNPHSLLFRQPDVKADEGRLGAEEGDSGAEAQRRDGGSALPR